MTSAAALLADTQAQEYIQAAHCTRPALDPNRGRRQISLVVLHSAEAPEKPGKARDVALWFAGQRGPAPEASAHYVVDAGETVQCVLDRDVAWAAPGANATGLHVELVGFAGQTPVEWADEYSAAVLERAAGLVAVLCARYGIPARVLSSVDLRNLQSGITTHAAVSEAFRKSNHTDPGAGFPLAAFVERVAELKREGRSA